MLRENYILVTPRFQRKSRVRIETKRIDQLRVQNNFTLFFFFYRRRELENTIFEIFE